MATIRTTYKFQCDLDKGTFETTLRNSLMQADAMADAFAVTVQRNGADVDISGMTVYGYLYANATKTTVPLKGTVSGSTATVILSEDCYAVPGYASLVIQIHDGDVRHTVLKVDFVVTRTGGTLVLDGDNILPSLAELLGQISAMEQATAEAKAATEVANQAVENVEAFKAEIQGDIDTLTEEIDGVKNDLIEPSIDYGGQILSGDMVKTAADDGIVTVNGDAFDYSGSTFAETKWVAFPLVDLPTSTYQIVVTVNDAALIENVYKTKYTTSESSGFQLQTFAKDGNVFSCQCSISDNNSFLTIIPKYNTDAFTANVNITNASGDTVVKNGIVAYSSLTTDMQSRMDAIVKNKAQTTSLYMGDGAGNKAVEGPGDDGKYNAAFGVNVMMYNTTGDHCSAFGFQAMQNNISGDANTAFGEDALFSNTTGGGNVAVGSHAAQDSNGNGNTVVGESAALRMANGNYNVIIGSGAGFSGSPENAVSDDERLILIGTGAGKKTEEVLSNSIAIGDQAKTDKSNQMVLGNALMTEVVLAGKKIMFNVDGTVTWETV